MRLFHKIEIFSFVFCLLTLQSCESEIKPKPYGYFRVDLPTHSYEKIENERFPFIFETSTHSKVEYYDVVGKENWFDLTYPSLKANVYFSYKKVDNNLLQLLDETRYIAYKHRVRASSISEKTYENRNNKVLGIVYELSGDVASTYQFVLTDSVEHFVRAALYFDATPNADSIAPINAYVKKDLVHLIETFEWEK